MQNKSHRSSIIRYNITGLLIAAGFIIFTALFAFLTVADRRSTLANTAETLEYIKRTVILYENGLANDEAKSLTRLMDRALELSYDLTAGAEEKISTASLDMIAHNQRLDGIIILDDSLETIAETDTDGRDEDFWDELIKSPGMSDIPKHKKKLFMTRVERGGDCYDVSAVPRLDADGMIFVYSKKEKNAASSDSLSLSNMFRGYNFVNDGLVVICDENSVIACNEDKYMGRNVRDAIKDKSITSKTEDDGLECISFNDNTYYGGRIKAMNYTVYVMFPSGEIFSRRSFVMNCGILIYALLCIVVFLQRSYSEQKYLQQIEKQYRTISAISSIYSTTFIIRPNADQLEIVKAPESVKDKIEPVSGAKEKLKILTEIYISEPYRKEHGRFSDVSTMAERLKGKRSMTLTYEDVFGEWYESIMIPQRYDDNGNVDGVLIATRNCSEEKRRELEYQDKLRKAVSAAERANNAKTDFLRRMSHDIRTPINGIRGMVEIGEYYADDMKKQAECRKKIWNASGFLLSLVNDVLDMGKLESGTVTLENKPFMLHEIFNEAVSLTEPQAGELGIRYIVSTEADKIKHDRLIGSPLHLLRILQNILSNAIKYNKKCGSVKAYYYEQSSDDYTAFITFVCEDTGLGMSKEFQEHAFEPFVQEDENARTMYKGTGLGLAIVKELTERMGGTLKLESELGKGSRITVTIPFRLDKEERHDEDKNTDDVDISGTNVLLVEDNELNMEIAEFVLENADVRVTSAYNGKEAVEKFAASRTGEFDMIFMDIMMPEMDGLEAARRIRAMDRADAKTVPICAMTANAFSDDAELSIKAGMNEHLTKPLDREKIIQVLRKYKH